MTDHIFPPSLALKALSFGPYRNAAYAISELIDNSADAEAKFIAVALIVDGSNRPSEIAVLDNGIGMDRELLRRCVQYGYGAAGNDSDPSEGAKSRAGKRLGKFGVGLVAASFSQCLDLQVMSWQQGESSAGVLPSTRLRLSDESEINENLLPDTFDEKIPDWANLAFDGLPEPISAMKSGTLVVWRDVSTTHRRRAKTLRKHICDLCGRIHREFIRSNKLRILVNVFDKSSSKIIDRAWAEPVDPTFLTNWDEDDLKKDGFVGNQTLFTPYTGHPDDTGEDIDGEYQPQMKTVKGPDGEMVGHYLLTSSYRRPHVVEDEKLTKYYKDPGLAPFGKLANNLRGVSLMRSGREIELDPAWLRGDRTVDRWVSVSIDFDPDLDDVFGVSNDKQQVRGLSDLASIPLKEIKERLTELQEENNPEEDWRNIQCLEVAKQIKERLADMQRIVGKQREKTRSRAGRPGSNDPYTPPVEELTQDGGALSTNGRQIPMDGTKPSSDPEKTTEVYGNTLAGGKPAREVRPSEIIENDLKLDYVLNPHGPATKMFGFSLGPGHLVVQFNEKHPLSETMARLLAFEEGDDDEGDNENVSYQLGVGDALRVIRGLVASFVRAQAEADNLGKFDEVRALDVSLALWSEKATHVLESEE
ncbi:MAG: ATP-binding protein [Rhodobacteraceae bacterium]|nr:ATP-binding protein [Gammaproteobacteria bacterium]MCY4327552.1 ATP-binding protein [Paracoccaceae bacterium]